MDSASIDRSVLIIGERGTGKELAAERLHYLSLRWDQTFTKINCSAIAEPLLESEFFGHEAVTFTGATKQHIGRLLTDGGTLFLDELATISLRCERRTPCLTATRQQSAHREFLQKSRSPDRKAGIWPQLPRLVRGYRRAEIKHRANRVCAPPVHLRYLRRAENARALDQPDAGSHSPGCTLSRTSRDRRDGEWPQRRCRLPAPPYLPLSAQGKSAPSGLPSWTAPPLDTALAGRRRIGLR